MAKRRTQGQIQEAVKAVARDVARGLTGADSRRCHGITEQSYYRWRRRQADATEERTARVRELAVEAGRLKQLQAEVMLDNQMLREVAQKKW
jgi:putative transposase